MLNVGAWGVPPLVPVKPPGEARHRTSTVDLVRRAPAAGTGDNIDMAVGEKSAQEPTPVFDAVLASVQAAVQAQGQVDGEAESLGHTEVAATV
ncbi:hypothetical protein GCM10017566_37750 [Amycolatopsis bartoniae]|uniref:Uncharacterized protein n=1 Tax=Amycolatopsis bartoniae TaxID=941986 RepID=A0A8H9IYK2_9PSEU|nr:hypothetical protein GCM10017566_37750 [Amycolatopsis bartoniae]